MATDTLSPDNVTLAVSGDHIQLIVGVQGPDGTSSVTVSPDPENTLEKRPDGLFVPGMTLTTNQW